MAIAQGQDNRLTSGLRSHGVGGIRRPEFIGLVVPVFKSMSIATHLEGDAQDARRREVERLPFKYCLMGMARSSQAGGDSCPVEAHHMAKRGLGGRMAGEAFRVLPPPGHAGTTVLSFRM